MRHRVLDHVAKRASAERHALMSTRQSWTIDGYHFTKTTTERGGTRCFIDGAPTKQHIWREQMTRARKNEAKLHCEYIEQHGVTLSVND